MKTITSKEYIAACILKTAYEKQQQEIPEFLTLEELEAKDPEGYKEKIALYEIAKARFEEECNKTKLL